MALNIKNAHVEQLAHEIAHLTGESKTEAIRQALLERRARLRFRVPGDQKLTRLESFLEREVWARVPEEQLGAAPDKPERDQLLGYGNEGA